MCTILGIKLDKYVLSNMYKISYLRTAKQLIKSIFRNNYGLIRNKWESQI